MLIEIEKILLKEMPYCILVQGDTNSTLAGALAAGKITTTESYTGFNIRVAHVEAGLRSFDRTMPEEINRFITDHISDFLFVPTKNEKEILLKEGVPKGRIHITGNTIVDAVEQSLRLAKQNSRILDKLGLGKNSYILLTLHRQENVDSKRIVVNILKSLTMVRRKLNLPIIFSMHPRTAKMLKEFKFRMPDSVHVIAPVGFLDFLMLEANAALVMTDSGGVQEETCILEVPCVTLRNNTERPETVNVGSNIIAGRDPENIVLASCRILASKKKWTNPFGDGNAAQRILDVLVS
jgi:UDP-N-acetylglucosamine 2-epimerase (non-hydrolysing)